MRAGRDDNGGQTAPPSDVAPEIVPEPLEAGRDHRESLMFHSRVAGGLGLAVCVLVFGEVWIKGYVLGPRVVLLVFLAFQAVSWAAAYRLQPSDSQFVQQFDEAVFVAGVMLLEPSGVVLTLGLGTALGLVLLRTWPRAICLNGGVLTVASLLGVLTVSRISPDMHTASVRLLIAVVVGTVVLAVVNETLLALYFHVALRDPFASGLSELLLFRPDERHFSS